MSERIRIGPADIDVCTIESAAEHIADEAAAGRGGYVVTHNLEHLWLREHDAEFDRLSGLADLVVADGQPLVLVSRIQGTPLPERVGGIDLFEQLVAEAARRDLSIYLVGGTGDTASEAADILRGRHDGLRIVGAHAPADGLAADPDALGAEVRMVAAAEPDLVFVGLPSRLQLITAEQLRDLAPNAWIQGVGVSFSFVTGEVTRAPAWVQRLGLEWLHRMVQQPGLTRRYLVHCVPLGLRLLGGAVRGRVRGWARG